MGAIYQGYDLKLDIPVAIKENFFRTPQGVEQFEQEARILARLHHPNLPRVIDHFTFEDKQYLVMDFIEGQDLWEILETQKQPLNEKEALDYIIQICDAVSYLHRQEPPIVHRDIKPQNIKVTPTGRAVLVDFGIAKVADTHGRTRTGAQAITPGFSPPEQYGSQGTTPVSDIYSLGATLYAVLTGRYPPDSISLMTGGAQLKPPNTLNTKLSQQVSSTVEYAMQIMQEHRPQSIDAWLNELLAVRAGQLITRRLLPEEESMDEEGQTVVLPPKTRFSQQSYAPPTGAGQALKSNPPWFWIGVAIGALAIASGAVAFLIGRSGGNGPIDTETILIALAATATEQAKTGIVEPNIDLAATLVALAATATAQTQLQPTPSISSLTDAATPTPPASTDTPSPTPTPTPAPPTPTPTATATATPTTVTAFATPDLGRIAFVSGRDGDAEIYLMNPDGGKLTNLTNDPFNNDSMPAWSPNGQELIFTSHNISEENTLANTSVRAISVSGGRIRTLTTQAGSPAWSPDGAYLAVRALNNRIFIVDTENWRGNQLTPGNGFNPTWSPDGRQILFDNGVDLFVINKDGTGLTPLTSSVADESQPVWSPDGQYIAFVSNGDGNNEIYIMNVADRNTVRRLTTSPGHDVHPGWSPDGSRIAFASNRTGNWEIFVMNADGSQQTNLTRHPGPDEQPVWSPKYIIRGIE
jgi:Tol biopolymer transport system component